MAKDKEFEKLYTLLVVIAVGVIIMNFYYFCHPFFAARGLTSPYIDGMFMELRKTGYFKHPLYTKAFAVLLLIFSTITRSGKGKDANWTVIGSLLLSGTVLYVCDFGNAVPYMAATVVGAMLISYASALIGRRIQGFDPDEYDEDESFEQCEKKIDTDDSINIKIRYKFKGRVRTAWANVVNPYRASMVLGTPGAGKSYSIYNAFLHQMVKKGYSMFVYDYKYPDLTEVVYNEMLDRYGNSKNEIIPEFHVINFDDPRYSERCNPIHPRYIKDSVDTTEIAELVMLNVNKSAVEKEDFFTMSAKVYLDALIYFLSIYKGGKYCTFPHVIELMGQNYERVFRILSKEPRLAVKISPFKNALDADAQDQLQGQIASAQIPLLKFVSPQLYWALSADDFSLDINDPKHPKILCVGNNPDRQTIYGTTLALLTSRMFKLINHKGRLKCGVLLDELPTIFLKGLDNLIATARSNKVAIVLGAQDKTQLVRDYTQKEADVIFNTIGNTFCGQVNGRTAEDMCKSFGKQKRKKVSQTQNMDSDSVSISYEWEDVLPVSKIETLSQGVFLGKVADSFKHRIRKKFFFGEVITDEEHMDKLRANWKTVPQMTSFGEDEIMEEVERDQEYIIKETLIEKFMQEHGEEYDNMTGTELADLRDRLFEECTEEDRKEILEKEIALRIREAVNSTLEQNYFRIKDEIAELMEELDPPQEEEEEEEEEDGDKGNGSSGNDDGGEGSEGGMSGKGKNVVQEDREAAEYAKQQKEYESVSYFS